MIQKNNCDIIEFWSKKKVWLECWICCSIMHENIELNFPYKSYKKFSSGNPGNHGKSYLIGCVTYHKNLPSWKIRKLCCAMRVANKGLKQSQSGATGLTQVKIVKPAALFKKGCFVINIFALLVNLQHIQMTMTQNYKNVKTATSSDIVE